VTGSAPKLVVADAGPLIALATIGGLHWLQLLFRNVLIPDAVAAELCLDSRMPGAVALAAARDQGWLTVVAVADVPMRLLSTIDRGEAEAIVLARRESVPLLIDESRGRMAAKNEGVAVFGTGALLIRAKEKDLIREVRPSLDALSRAQYRLSNALRQEILRLAGETATPAPA
jgi:predicted nucleic acid-binding protein